MSKKILLTTGEYTIVDNEDYESLIEFSSYWRLSGRYVICVKNKKVVRMHRLLMGAKGGEIVDHRNHNPLDNQKHNLRVTNHTGNTRNARKTSKETSSKYKGVNFDKNTGAWKVSISTKQIGRMHIGYYSNEDAAGLAYNEHAKKHFGEFAHLNTVENIDISPDDFLVKRKEYSQHKGITFNKGKSKWEAQVYQDKKVKKLGTAESEFEALKILEDYISSSDDEDLRRRYGK